jgi:hypothetical protein
MPAGRCHPGPGMTLIDRPERHILVSSHRLARCCRGMGVMIAMVSSDVVMIVRKWALMTF